jgi:hypothetical protein
VNITEQVFAAAANAGFLKPCNWYSSWGSQSGLVAFKANDETVLHDLALSLSTQISFPATVFVGIKRGDRLVIDGQSYRAKDVRVVADGSQIHVEVAKS